MQVLPIQEASGETEGKKARGKTTRLSSRDLEQDPSTMRPSVLVFSILVLSNSRSAQ